MNEPYRLRYTNQIVGVFLLVFLVFLFIFSLMVFQVNDRFGKKDRFWISAKESEIRDLNRGAEVIILGQPAGEVRSIDYDDDPRMIRVVIQVDREMSKHIFSNSVVQLQRKFGVGAPVLVIRREATDIGAEAPLPPNSQLKNFRGEVDRVEQLASEVQVMAESIRTISQSAKPSLESVQSAADRVQVTLNDSFDPTLNKAEEASESFLETNVLVRGATSNLESRMVSMTEKIEALVDQDMRDTLRDLRKSTEAFNDTSRSVTRTSEGLNQDVAETLVQMREAIEQVRLLAVETRDLVHVLQREADELPGTTARVQDTVSETQDLVGEIRSHWLLRRYTNQSTPSSQVAPSSVRGGPRP